MSVNMEKHIFGFSASHFFNLLKEANERYVSGNVRREEDLFLIIIGLNQLRDWIAPGHKHGQDADTPKKQFHEQIFNELREFREINKLANGVKHFTKKENNETSKNYDNTISSWDTLADVETLSKGVVVQHTFYDEGIEGYRDVQEIIDPVIKYYEDNWFSR